MVDGLWLTFMEVEVMVDGLYVVKICGLWFLVNGLLLKGLWLTVYGSWLMVSG